MSPPQVTFAAVNFKVVILLLFIPYISLLPLGVFCVGTLSYGVVLGVQSILAMIWLKQR